MACTLLKNQQKTSRQIIKGIGPETADFILLYTFDSPNFVVGTYTRRIFYRLRYEMPDSYEYCSLTFIQNMHLIFVIRHIILK